MTTHPNYYVSAINGTRRYLIAGPYPTHAEALDLVGPVKDLALTRDARAWFMAWGTAGGPDAHDTPLGAWRPEPAKVEAVQGALFECA